MAIPDFELTGATNPLRLKAVSFLDDHFTNRCTAAVGMDKPGCLRQAGKPSRASLPGKDVGHAQSICSRHRFDPRES
jgi:hypothetical protein